jgi:hypothetical protein
VFSSNDSSYLQALKLKGLDVVRSSVVHRETQGQVEVTVKERTVPPYAQLATTHQSPNRLGVKRFSKESKVILLFVFPSELCSESPQRHIRDGKEMGEDDPKATGKLPSVVLLKSRLGRWQKRPAGIVDEVQGQEGFIPITQTVQSFDHCDALPIDSGSALSADVLFQVTRHRGHKTNLVFPKELRHLLHARFEEHGQVRSDLHPMTSSTKGRHETAKVRIELRRPARKIDKLTTRSFAGLKNQFHDGPFHHLFSAG